MANFLQMSHVVWSVCLCVLGTAVNFAKTAEPIEMLTQVGPMNHVLDGGPHTALEREHF